jgi:phage-related protein
VSPHDKPLVRLGGQIKTPPLSHEARLEVGFLLRRLQQGESLTMPDSKAMPSIGARCHELRVRDGVVDWRLMHRIDHNAIVVLEVFSKKTQKTPKAVIDLCQKRLKEYDRDRKDEGKHSKEAGKQGVDRRRR